MDWQYIIVVLVVAGAVTFALHAVWKEFRHQFYYKNVGCGGCPLVEKCCKKEKKQ